METGGVPSVTLVTKIFGALAITVSRGVGFDALRIHQLPHPLNPLPEERVREITREHLPAIVAELLQQTAKDAR